MNVSRNESMEALDKHAGLNERERRDELETKLGELYDKLYAEIWLAGSTRSYVHSSGREDFIKNGMAIVDNEIEQSKKSKSPPAVADSRETTKYEKPALHE